jgi:hypothetical protein
MDDKQIKFGHITIKPVIRKRKYVSEFLVTAPLKVETTIGGNSPEECLEKTEVFLHVKINPEQYTIIS